MVERGQRSVGSQVRKSELTDLEKFLPELLQLFRASPRRTGQRCGQRVSLRDRDLACLPRQPIGKAVIVDIFDEMKQAPGASTDPMDTVLGAQGSSLGQEFATFAVWNTATGAGAPEGVGYPNAARSQAKPEAIDTALLPATVSDLTASLSVHYSSGRRTKPSRRYPDRLGENSALLVLLVEARRSSATPRRSPPIRRVQRSSSSLGLRLKRATHRTRSRLL